MAFKHALFLFYYAKVMEIFKKKVFFRNFFLFLQIVTNGNEKNAFQQVRQKVDCKAATSGFPRKK